jgi:hypothetical protein
LDRVCLHVRLLPACALHYLELSDCSDVLNRIAYPQVVQNPAPFSDRVMVMPNLYGQ